MLISIVIPVFHNTNTIPDLGLALDKLESSINKINHEIEVIFVDDGSSDDSYQKIVALKCGKANYKVIKHTRNFGAVSAVKSGLQFIKGDCFSILSADLQDDPLLIYNMIPEWERGHKLVIYVRSSRDDPFVTRILAKIYYRILNIIAIPDFPKGGFDLALIDKTLLEPILKSSKNTHLPPFIFWLGYKPKILKYHRSKRKYGKSMWTFSKKLKAFIDVLIGFSIFPVRFMSVVGLIVAMISFAYGTALVIQKLVFGNPVQGFTTLTCLLCFLLGLIILMLGLIGEYLWRIYDQTNSRPESIIESVS